MTISAEIKTVLATACTRVFPDFAPVGTTRPYVTYRQVGGQPINPLDKTVPGQAFRAFQINVWANSRASAALTMAAIDSAMRQATTFIALPVSEPVSDFDADVPVFGAEQDWEIFSDR